MKRAKSHRHSLARTQTRKEERETRKRKRKRKRTKTKEEGTSQQKKTMIVCKQKKTRKKDTNPKQMIYQRVKKRLS